MSIEWISVEDELPLVAGPYLVIRKENPWITTRRFNWKGQWESGATVTHWAEYPETPKES